VEIEAMVTHALDGTALFAARFRECASRALLLPRRDPRRRTPLWAQRKRSADLLAVASRHPSFPIVLETYRECLRDAFDLPGLTQLLQDVAARRVRVTTVDTRAPSPFAANVLFAFVANFIYEGDAPLAERRAQALSIDLDRLRELLGDDTLRDLLDPQVIEDHERGLQRLSRPATHADAVHDLLLSVGDLSSDELRARSSPPERVDEWLRDLQRVRRVVAVRIAGVARFVAAEDAARVRDGLGAVLPRGLPAALLERAPRPVRDLVARYARTHGPFTLREAAGRLGLDVRTVERAADELIAERRIVRGAFLPGGTQPEHCDREVLDAIRRKSLAKLRRAVEPVDVAALARFLPEWHGIPQRRRGREALLAVIAELEGCPLLVSGLETHVLPARIEGYRGWELDALCASGQVVWAGIEPLGRGDGRIAFYLAEHEPLLARPAAPVDGALAARMREVLARRGAMFFGDLARELGVFPGEAFDMLWQMTWAGEVTNDTIEPLRGRARLEQGSARRLRSPANGRGPRSALPGTEGRWSLRSARAGAPPGDAERRTALTRALLDRYGVVTREAAHAEGIAGGFSAVYDVFKVLEDQGRVRRGYFVAGRGGAQFATPGADDRLRALREPREDVRPIVLAATDPASVWGALVAWPAAANDARPQRAAGALVILRDGALLGWLGRGKHPLLTFLPTDPAERAETAGALATALGDLVDRGRRRALLLWTIDGAAASESDLAPAFVRAGFVSTGSRHLIKRTTRPRAHDEDWSMATSDA
jgi:ATP-dependent Lhr-like helicase